MKKLVVEPGMTQEEKGVIVLTLVERVQDTSRKSGKAFRNLFGTNAPHQILEKLSHLNARACIDEYNESVFRLLAEDPRDFYSDADFHENHTIANMTDWNEGMILHRWERYTDMPNPHHIIPRSRGGTSHRRNLWRADRKIHDDIHTVFQNLTPQDQMRLVMNYFKLQFSRDFSASVYKILGQYAEPDCYIEGTVALNRFC